MSELKTLKDIRKNQVERMKQHLEPFGKGKNRNIDPRESTMLLMLPFVFEKSLKAEAMKWYKNMKYNKIAKEEHIFSGELQGAKDFIKLFFNLTEEDLK